MDSLLLKLLGASFNDSEVLQRQSLGNIVHIFSHIRMTLLVERLVLKVCPVYISTQKLGRLLLRGYLTAAPMMVLEKQHPPWL